MRPEMETQSTKERKENTEGIPLSPWLTLKDVLADQVMHGIPNQLRVLSATLSPLCLLGCGKAMVGSA
jgi:hypothetical protein